MNELETLSHRLILPQDANHYGTLYAGSLLRIALESAYATAYRLVGAEANLVLRRVLSVECYNPVPVGRVVEIRGIALHIRRAYVIIGLLGSPLEGRGNPWMDGLMGFVQVDRAGSPTAFPAAIALPPSKDTCWQPLRERTAKLLRLKAMP